MTWSEPFEPELDPEVAEASGLRKGWTTGTCASAAAKAAALWLATGNPPATVEVGLPSGDRVSFDVSDVDLDRPHQCAVIKDAGDDPDCTNGAHMTAAVAWQDGDGGGDGGNDPVIFEAGDGVGVVTKLGLGLPVGAPSITPVPRRMITAAIREATTRPVRCVLSVPGGQAMAKKTSNERLGIVGGISILGTTGIVKPFSTAAYRASVVQQIDVAAAQGETTVVLATGSRSDAWAQAAWPDLAPVCFVEVGDFTGIALRRCTTDGIRHVRFVGMVGKITKLAAGVMMTHFRRTAVDTELLTDVARATGASPQVLTAASATNTARHFFDVCVERHELTPLAELCRRAVVNCVAHSGHSLSVEVVMVDFEGAGEVARA